MTDEAWSWRDLIPIIPVIASAFAFAYVVGYFYAFDIAWFPFFSLPEHLVFALRALPIAIGALVGLLIALKHFPNENRWLTYPWIAWLLLVAALALQRNHLGLFVSFCLVGAGTWFYSNLPSPRLPSQRLLFWATNLLVLCLMCGFLSGLVRRQPFFHQFDRCMTPIRSDSTAPTLSGHVLFAGNSWVLFYDVKSNTAMLLKRDDITRIEEPGNLRPSQKSVSPKSG